MTEQARPEQRTLAQETAIEGVGLHTGASVRVRFVPAAPGTGIRFRRTDLPGGPEIPATLSHVSAGPDRRVTVTVDQTNAPASDSANSHYSRVDVSCTYSLRYLPRLPSYTVANAINVRRTSIFRNLY